MTIEKAKQIRYLLDCRNKLISELNDIRTCQSITGYINDGVNGLGFSWKQGSKKIQHLINGILKEIADIENAIINFQTEGATNNEKNPHII